MTSCASRDPTTTTLRHLQAFGRASGETPRARNREASRGIARPEALAWTQSKVRTTSSTRTGERETSEPTASAPDESSNLRSCGVFECAVPAVSRGHFLGLRRSSVGLGFSKHAKVGLRRVQAYMSRSNVVDTAA